MPRTARALDRELGAEDCAAVAALDHRALFEKARPQTAGGAQPKSFATYRPVSPRPLPTDPACKAAFEKRMSDALYERNRSTFFKANIWRSGADHHMDLVFGRLAAARDLLGKTADDGARVQHDITAQVTDRSTERCHAIFHDDSGELDVSGHDWMKEIVRRSFGGAYFGSEAHFMGDETITLAPLADLEAALSTAGIPGIKSVELQEAWIDLGGDVPSWVCAGARGNCLNSPAADFLLRALSKGVPSEATFLLGLTLRARALRVKLVPPRRMEFERRDPRVVRIVRDWVVAQRFMTVAEALGASDDAIESLRMSERGDP